MVKQSPLFYADRVKTPTLFVHGEVDYRVPYSEAEQFYFALKKNGVPAKIIQYEGPRDPDKMYKDGRFVDVRSASLRGSKVQAARGIFPEWALDASFTFDEEVLDFHNLNRLVATAGKFVGVGTYRKKFGRFTAECQDVGELATAEAA